MKNHPIGRLWSILGRDINELDNNPRVQLRIHTAGFWYWTINFPLIVYIFFFQQNAWNRWGLFITLMYSIYANWSTDYSGMSSSQTVINTSRKPDEKL